MGIPNPSAALSGDDVDTERALHYAVLKTATYSALVGQFRHHFGERDLPAALAQADSDAFDDATLLCENAQSAETGDPLYDLAVVTRHAFESGRAHNEGDCVFCDDTCELDELATVAIAQATAMVAVI